MSGLDNRLYIYHSQILCWAVGEGNKENKALYSPRTVPEVNFLMTQKDGESLLINDYTVAVWHSSFYFCSGQPRPEFKIFFGGRSK